MMEFLWFIFENIKYLNVINSICDIYVDLIIIFKMCIK